MRAFWKVTRYARAARFWWVMLLIAAGFFGCNEVRAQEFVCIANDPRVCNRPQALAECEVRGAQLVEGLSSSYQWRCLAQLGSQNQYVAQRALNGVNWTTGAAPNGFKWMAEECPAGQIWNDLAGQQRCMQACTSRGTPTFTPAAGQMLPDGTIGCNDGCQYVATSNEDGTYTRNFIGDGALSHCSVVMTNCTLAGYTLNFGLGMCVPPVAECAPNEVKDPLTGACTQGCPLGSVMDTHGLCVPEADQCPAGHIRSPDGSCLPGEGQCATGETRKPDGTCGADDFDPDTDDTSFSGGDNCNAPPACNGDAIMCGQARIQWRIECNTRDEAQVSGGSCGAVPICAGRNCKALEYAQLLQQWRATCALEKLAEDGIGGGGDDDDTTEGYDPTVDATTVADLMAGEGDPADAFTDGSENNGGTGGNPGGDGELDDSGLGFGTSCPNLPTINVLGNTLDFQAAIGSKMCDWFRLGGQIVLILAALLSLRILSGGATV